MLPDSVLPDSEDLADAAAEVVDCMRVLEKSGSNLVLEALARPRLRGTGALSPWRRARPRNAQPVLFPCPSGIAMREPDFGHFHTFLRPGALPDDTEPVALPGNPANRNDAEATAHLIAISMDRYGRPTALFTTNRWVTDETLYSTDVLISALPAFAMDVAHPSWPLNRWITAMLTLYRVEIANLLCDRDQILEQHAQAHPGVDVLNDRALEITSHRFIDLEAKLAEVRSQICLT